MIILDNILSLFKKKKETEFEEELHCQAICNFYYKGEEIGGFFLKQGDRYEIRFGFLIENIHPYQSSNKTDKILKSWNEGLHSLTKEGLRIHQINSSDNDDRLIYLDKRAERINNDSLAYLEMGKKELLKEQIRNNQRCSYTNIAFAPYIYTLNRAEQDDLLEEKLSWIIDKYSYLNQDKQKETEEFYKKLFQQSFYQGYLIWKQTLNNRFRFPKIKAFDGREMWNYIWQEFNLTKTPPIPHLIDIYVKDNSITINEKFGSSRCLGSTLLSGGKNKHSIPYRQQQWNHWIFVKNKYIGAVVLENEFEGYDDDDDEQFQFFWQRLKNIPNSEIVWEVNPVNQKIEEFLMKRRVRGNSWDIKETKKSGDVNIRAEESNKDIFLAQRKMLANTKVCSLSVVIYVYRNSIAQLNNDLNNIVNMFPSNSFLREMDEVDTLWLNKLPIVTRKLVRKERQIKMFSDEIPIPVVSPQKLDDEGFELTTVEGHKPIYINFLKKHRGMLVASQTGKGKTTFITDTAIFNLADGIKSVCVDYGNADGSTSYTDCVNGMGKAGVNLQAGVDDYNLIQTPNFSRLNDPELEKKHSLSSRGFITSFVKSIVLGDDRTSKTAKRVSSMLGCLIPEFYNNREIKEKFLAGHRHGLGSPDWLKMPTLIDFKGFIENISEEEFGNSSIYREAKEEILWGLNTFIRSRLGQKLSVTSKIDIEADFLCISMREARDDDEMALLSLCAQSLAINQALKHPKCYVILDEGNILGKNKSVLTGISEFVVNGRKGGLFCSFLLQHVDTLIKAGDLGQAIIDNLPIKMIGSIAESAIENIAGALKIPEYVFYENASDRFEPNSLTLASYWLMIANGLRIPVAHRPSPELMALVASQPEESKARKRYLNAYPTFLEAMSAFTPDYVRARNGSKDFDKLNPTVSKIRLDKNYEKIAV